MSDKRPDPDPDPAETPGTTAEQPPAPAGRELNEDELSRVSGGRGEILKIPMPPAPFKSRF